MKRIAAPIVGGVFTTFLLELLVYPRIYEAWKWHFQREKQAGSGRPSSEELNDVLEPVSV